jgi:hypothetical protein
VEHSPCTYVLPVALAKIPPPQFLRLQLSCLTAPEEASNTKPSSRPPLASHVTKAEGRYEFVAGPIETRSGVCPR